jgi:ATP-binding cassette subfamily B protein
VLSGPPLGLSGTLTAGSFVTFMIYTRQFIWPMAQFGRIINNYQRAKASSERVYGLMNEPGRLDDAGSEGNRDDGAGLDFDGSGGVEFDDVTFGYDEDPVVADVDLRVEAGETIGFVGPTGRANPPSSSYWFGCTTPTTGRSGSAARTVRDVSLRTLRESVGYVSQEPFLFGGSVRENIVYGAFDATDEEVEDAARAARAHEFITNLPEGYETTVGERGVKLSGGQRQRLSIARTILKDPEILLLDEATSHVDTETEALIQHSLDAFAADKTTFAIAHRLSTIKGADEIVVLEDGRVSEQGTYEELLAADGLYANFWRVQAGDAGALPQDFLERTNRRRAEVNG